MIQETKIRPFFFFGILTGAVILTLAIFWPFLSPLLLAGSLALIFHPVYRYIDHKLGSMPSLSALLTVVLIFLIVIIPLTFLAGQLFIEARNFYEVISSGPSTTGPISELVDRLNQQLSEVAPFLSIDLASTQAEITDWLIGNFNFLFSGALQTILNIFVFLFGLFYFTRDGEKLRQAIISISPLSDNDDRKIFYKIRKTINSVFLGSLLIALAQGVLTALGFLIFGVPQPVLWGALGAIVSLVPSVGPAILFIPVVIFKFVSGDMVSAVGLAVWAMLVVSSADNIMRPYLIERGMKVHPFMILISVLGGLIIFGPIGFLLGPIILSLLFALLGIYQEITSQTKAQS